MSYGNDNFSTRFESMYAPTGNVYSSWNMGGYGMPGTAAEGYGGYIVNPMLNAYNPREVVHNDKFVNNYYNRPAIKQKKDDNVPAALGILASAVATTVVAVAAFKIRGAKKMAQKTVDKMSGKLQKVKSKLTKQKAINKDLQTSNSGMRQYINESFLPQYGP